MQPKQCFEDNLYVPIFILEEKKNLKISELNASLKKLGEKYSIGPPHRRKWILKKKRVEISKTENKEEVVISTKPKVLSFKK